MPLDPAECGRPAAAPPPCRPLTPLENGEPVVGVRHTSGNAGPAQNCRPVLVWPGRATMQHLHTLTSALEMELSKCRQAEPLRVRPLGSNCGARNHPRTGNHPRSTVSPGFELPLRHSQDARYNPPNETNRASTCPESDSPEVTIERETICVQVDLNKFRVSYWSDRFRRNTRGRVHRCCMGGLRPKTNIRHKIHIGCHRQASVEPSACQPLVIPGIDLSSLGAIEDLRPVASFNRVGKEGLPIVGCTPFGPE